jgi:hypothetical protein
MKVSGCIHHYHPVVSFAGWQLATHQLPASAHVCIVCQLALGLPEHDATERFLGSRAVSAMIATGGGAACNADRWSTQLGDA